MPLKQNKKSMAEKPTSGLDRGPVILAVDDRPHIDIWFDEHLRRQFSLMVACALSGCAGGGSLIEVVGSLPGRREEIIEALDGLHRQTWRAGPCHIRLTQWRAKMVHDLFVILALNSTHLTHARVLAAMAAVLPILPEGINVYIEAPRLPELTEEILATGPPYERTNYERLRCEPRGAPCPIRLGDIVRLEGWLSSINPRARGVLKFARRLRQIAGPYLDAIRNIEGLGWKSPGNIKKS